MLTCHRDCIHGNYASPFDCSAAVIQGPRATNQNDTKLGGGVILNGQLSAWLQFHFDSVVSTALYPGWPDWVRQEAQASSPITSDPLRARTRVRGKIPLFLKKGTPTKISIKTLPDTKLSKRIKEMWSDIQEISHRI
ncbi:hypothetical protein chiPu_0012696 [Chiloscyllium punctatum]|uniref:Uncharacterized protein n=1 Tax=Chiloscyllium punctatum TaxID=137246 RepID=A0A401SV30_CHIPU|nr:hypothetical protein [Chiloscyllium punctatum]